MPCAVVLKGAPKDGVPFLDLCDLQTDKPLPESLEPDEALVRLRCRPVSPADVICLSGKCREFHPPDFPATPGLEGCGVVESVGEKVTRVKEGDRVLPLIPEKGHTGNGTWQEYIKAKETQLVKIPDDVSDETAALAFLNPCAVMGIMETLGIPKGKWLLCVGAESTYDKATIAYAHKQGVKVMCMVKDDGTKRELKGYGADLIINMSKEDVEARVLEETNNEGAYGSVCPAGGHVPDLVVSCTRVGGTVVIPQDFCDAQAAKYQPKNKEVKLVEFSLNRWLHDKYPNPEDRIELENKVFGLVKEGVFAPVVGKRFKLDEYEFAVREMMHSPRGGVPLLVS